jgi:hypothetical protein
MSSGVSVEGGDALIRNAPSDVLRVENEQLHAGLREIGEKRPTGSE